MPDKHYAYFQITGPGTHEEVSNRLDLEPSAAWNAGDLGPRDQPRRGMCWRLVSGLDEAETLGRHVEGLLLLLGARSSALRELWLEYTLTLHCVAHFSSTLGLHLDRECVRQLANLGIAVDLDFCGAEFARDD